MATKKTISISELIDSHRPKNVKYYFRLHHDEDLIELEQSGYDMNLLDTIQQPSLIQQAIEIPYKYYERTTVAKAKEPTMLERGVVLSKKMATKTDKKLIQVGIGFFDKDDIPYVAVKLCYERFDIYEIFILT